MTKHYGYGYEKESVDSPSIQTARADFLGLIPELKPVVISSLFNSAYQPFKELLANSRSMIASICESVKSKAIQLELDYSSRTPENIRKQAIERLLPNWCSLEQIAGAHALRQALQDWAQSVNLTKAWCLDHAVAFLRALDTRATEVQRWARRPRVFSAERIVDCWVVAIKKRRQGALWAQLPSNEIVAEHGVFSFTFKYKQLEFTVDGPFDYSTSAFKAEIKRQFEAIEGQKVRGVRTALANQLRVYLSDVAKVKKTLKLKEPPMLPAAQEHFKWLVEFLVPPTKKLAELAAIYSKPEQTISDGINRASRLIGIELHRHRPGRKQGQVRSRKLSRRESANKAARLKRTVEAIAAVDDPENDKKLAEKIGISPSHFRRAWRPDVLRQARQIIGKALTWEQFLGRKFQAAIKRQLGL